MEYIRFDNPSFDISEDKIQVTCFLRVELLTDKVPIYKNCLTDEIIKKELSIRNFRVNNSGNIDFLVKSKAKLNIKTDKGKFDAEIGKTLSLDRAQLKAIKKIKQLNFYLYSAIYKQLENQASTLDRITKSRIDNLENHVIEFAKNPVLK